MSCYSAASSVVSLALSVIIKDASGIISIGLVLVQCQCVIAASQSAVNRPIDHIDDHHASRGSVYNNLIILLRKQSLLNIVTSGGELQLDGRRCNGSDG